ncbi:hypothetical protein V3W47_09785 [Deinococcus sp. YIM 134068]|uniref:hypothetical protein n=1 Tax=Deinococcus lichenicola TaxID=3118910 RepID=UPI002F92808E
MEWREVLVYIACFGWFLGTLLVARVPLTPPSTGRRLGVALLLLALLACLGGLSIGVPGGPLLSNSVVALVCGSALGFGVFRKRDGSGREASRPSVPSRPLREEAPRLTQLVGVVLVCSSLFNLTGTANSGWKTTLGGHFLVFGFVALLLWLGLALMVLPPRWKVALGVGGGALALLIGALLPPQTL